MSRRRAQRLEALQLRATAVEQRASLERIALGSRFGKLLDQGRRSNWKLVAAGLLIRKLFAAVGLVRSPLGALAFLRLGLALFRRLSHGTNAARR
jgi:hypothetical protein